MGIAWMRRGWFYGLVCSVLLSGVVCRGAVTSVLSLSASNPPVPATLISPPVSAQDGSLFGGAFVWDELKDVVLGAGLPVDVKGFGNGIPGSYQVAGAPLTPGQIPAGTKISTFMIHFDTVSNATLDLAALQILTDEDIIGVIYRSGTLNQTDPLAGAPGTAYPTNLLFRGTADDPLEGSDQFVVGLPGDFGQGYSQSVHAFKMEVQGGLDEIRIVTTPHVPEPGMMALLGAGGLVLLGRRRMRV